MNYQRVWGSDFPTDTAKQFRNSRELRVAKVTGKK